MSEARCENTTTDWGSGKALAALSCLLRKRSSVTCDGLRVRRQLWAFAGHSITMALFGR
jgi:hypothetical protein